MGLHWFIPAEGPFPGHLPASKGLKPREMKKGKVRGERKGIVGKGKAEIVENRGQGAEEQETEALWPSCCRGFC